MNFHSNYSSSGSIRAFVALTLLLVVSAGCNGAASQQTLRLATATSTRDSGLLDRLLPPFEQKFRIRIEILAMGTGKAIKLGESGDVDVLLVHARAAEDKFMTAGHGVRHEEVMVNRFELLGPPGDPAQIRGMVASTALQEIASQAARFLSRGDESGTHRREMDLWNSLGGRPLWSNYRECGQGMGATLMIANQMSGYVLTDRATYLHFREQVDLVPLAKQAEELRNPYSVIAVNPSKHASVRAELADSFVDYLLSQDAQQTIAKYQVDGESLFKPLRLP